MPTEWLRLIDHLQLVVSFVPDSQPKAGAGDQAFVQIFLVEIQIQGLDMVLANSRPRVVDDNKLKGALGVIVIDESNDIEIHARLKSVQDRKSTRLNSSH